MGTLPGSLLITGADGQLGFDLVRILSPNYQVIATSCVELDITSHQQVKSFLHETRPAIVIHCAAWTDVDACEGDPARAMAVNGEGCRNVAEVCGDLDALMVYFSTDYVFDGSNRVPYVECDTVNPLTMYGKSKLAGEIAVRELAGEYIIARISWVYGAHGRNFIRSILDKGREQIAGRATGRVAEPLLVVSDQIGCPTWTVDIARQLELLLVRSMRGTFHVCASGAVSWYQLAQDVFSHLGMDVAVEPCTTEKLARPAPRPRYSVMENRRLTEAGCNIMPPYQQSLNRFLDQAAGAGL